MNSESARCYARIAGALLLISIVAGGFGEAYIPSRLVQSADPAATLRNLLDSAFLYRMSFASYLMEALSDVTLIFIFYLLLKPVSRNLALLSVLFGLTATATFAFAELFYFAPSLLISDSSSLKTWSPEQQTAFTQAMLSLYGYGAAVFMVFYGVASTIKGYLIARSRYLPSVLGILLAIAGLCFIIENFVFVIAPSYDSDLYKLPMFLAMLALSGWLLLKGVNSEKWNARLTAGENG